MFRKSLLSLAVASSVALTGCLDSGSSTNNANPSYGITSPSSGGSTSPVFNPITSELPIPNDLIIDATAKDGTFRVTPDPTNPVITALNEISGASTVAPIDITMSGQIDDATVDGRAIVVAGSTPIPNPTQNVFLLELKYASGDPLQGLSNAEPPTINVVDPAQYSVSVVQLSGQATIRITPTTPLKPRTRYLVVITNEVKDAGGQSLTSDTVYENVRDTSAPLLTSSLAPVRQLVTGLWEPIAAKYFALATNQTRAADKPLSQDNIVFSISLTTTGDDKVLQYIAEPSSWFTDQLTTFIRVSTAKGLAAKTTLAEKDIDGDGDFDFDDVNIAANAQVAAFPSADIQAAIPAFSLAPAAGGCQGLTGDTAIQCLGLVLAGAPSSSGGFADLLPTPKARTVGASLADAQDSIQVSAVLSSAGISPGDVTVVDGTLTVPYYLSAPNGADGSPLITGYWKADATLATALNSAFSTLGLSIPQANASNSTAINNIFPFPAKTTDETIPMLVLFNPASMNAATPVFIFQHGITTDRSAVLAYASNIVAATGATVVAIDQPLHGVVPATTEEKESLAGALLTAGQSNGLPPSLAPSATTIQSVVDKTITIGFVGSALSLDPTDPTDLATINGTIDTVIGGGTTGNASLDAAIYSLRSFENTVENAGSTIPGLAKSANERHFDFTADAASQPVAMTAANAASGSLFINLSSFLTSRDNLRQMSVDLMNLRASVAAIDMDANSTPDFSGPVYFIGHSLGTIDGAPFVAAVNENQTTYQHPIFNPGGFGIAANDIAAANLLTPGAGIVRTLENSPTFAPRILTGLSSIAGLQQGDADLETYFNVLQATLDTVDPINFGDNLAASSNVLLSMIVGDQVIPNSAAEGETLGNALPAPLSGSEALATVLGAADVKTGTVALPGITRYTAGTHGTPVLPTSGDTAAARVFAEMIAETVSVYLNGNTAVTVSDSGIVQQ